jgi:transposase
MDNITTIGLDFEGQVVLRKKLRRGQMLKFFGILPPCLVGMEACGSAHHWARELKAQGHEVRLIPPQYVRPFLKTNKHDAADAEAIAEALVRPTMRFAPIKSTDQQAVLMLHRSRELLVKQRTMLINAVRGHCSELGMTASQGASRVNDLLVIIENPDDARLPAFAREALGVLMAQLHTVKEAIRTLERKLQVWHRSQHASQRLTTIPGVGVITATALVATIGDGSQFQSGRHLSAWLGLVPRQHSSGGKSRLGRISKRGDGYIRRLLVHGSRAVLRWQRGAPKKPSLWIEGLLIRRPTNVVLVAMANKTARTVWAMMSKQQDFNAVCR